MNNAERLKELVRSVHVAYGNLEEPNYFFKEKQYKILLHHPFVLDLMSRYFIKNDTDLNNHVSLHLHILHNDGGMMACLSFVANWAMLFRLGAQNPIYTEVLDTSSSQLLPAEHDVLKLLRSFGFNLLSKKEAATPIYMRLFDTDEKETRLYHAIISDDGIVPRVLLD